jgi:dipeptidyl aminopeptidase/acylaminoacyl peptidase
VANDDAPRDAGGIALELRSSDGRHREYGVLDLDTGALTALAKPNEEALLAAYSAVSHAAVFSKSERDGTFIWRSSQDTQQTIELMAANTFLRDIAAGELRRFEYHSVDGRPLQAWILLPPDYQPGKRYPLFSWVYGGLVQGAEPPVSGRLDEPGAANMQLLAARGYAVLFPSMPLARYGTANDPMTSLPSGVLPALDKAIEMGFADGERLSVGGLSYGGYSTFALVTQTPRFKAAVSMAGPGADLISSYGTFDVSRRYAADAHLPHREGQWIPAWAESGQGAMGAPPWRDVARYVRNSPLFSVARVQTPLLIAYGDLDLNVATQGEELFTALYREGKRAQLVMYWGEGHGVDSPANLRDLWSRIYAWLDEFDDIARDADGNLLWDGDRVRSRHGAPALKPEQFLKFERMFAPAAVGAAPASASTQSR